MIAGVTRLRYRPAQADGAEEDLRELARYIEANIRDEQGFQRAIVTLDKDTVEALVATVWDSEDDLRRVEKIIGRDEPVGGRSAIDHLTDPTSPDAAEYARQRAALLAKRTGTIMEATDIFEVAIEIRP